ncbi:4-coumarate--CoA ligase-like 7 [Platanthera guangdongensis]|uniref:4-coumarate--CoA ligase-like 7 n=1 Tax=Platanthera guangdongensis TaxID=2320717 RepID=A0ABR2LN37_9ASPA
MKAAALTHRSFIAGTEGFLALRSSGNDVTLLPAPMFHSLGFFFTLGTVAMGDTLVVMGRGTFPGMMRAAERYGVTQLTAAPPVVVAMARSEEALRHDLSALERVVCGGAPISQNAAARFSSRFPTVMLCQASSPPSSHPVDPSSPGQPPPSAPYPSGASNILKVTFCALLGFPAISRIGRSERFRRPILLQIAIWRHSRVSPGAFLLPVAIIVADLGFPSQIWKSKGVKVAKEEINFACCRISCLRRRCLQSAVSDFVVRPPPCRFDRLQQMGGKKLRLPAPHLFFYTLFILANNGGGLDSEWESLKEERSELRRGGGGPGGGTLLGEFQTSGPAKKPNKHIYIVRKKRVHVHVLKGAWCMHEEMQRSETYQPKTWKEIAPVNLVPMHRACVKKSSSPSSSACSAIDSSTWFDFVGNECCRRLLFIQLHFAINDESIQIQPLPCVFSDREGIKGVGSATWILPSPPGIRSQGGLVAALDLLLAAADRNLEVSPAHDFLICRFVTRVPPLD